ncbi:unnamed protein product [Colias eurytheme]|nr:unnamed protein product [Colias eurytheme]
MKTFVLVCALIAATATAEEDKYKTVTDQINMETVVNDPKKMQEVMDCLLDVQPCSKLHADFLALVPEVIKTACAKCDSTQKHSANIFLNALRTKMPKEYDSFAKKFDPEGKYLDTLLENVKGH